MKRARDASSGDAGGGALSTDLIGMEFTELMHQLRVPATTYAHSAIRSYLFRLRDVLMSLDSREVLADDHTRDFPSLPLRRLGSELGGAPSLSFAAPARVDVVGSFLLRTAARTSSTALTIDLALQIPDDCFTAKDIKAHGYSDKRAMYLGALAASLRGAGGAGSGLVAGVAVEARDCDPTKPYLLLTPAKEAALQDALEEGEKAADDDDDSEDEEAAAAIGGSGSGSSSKHLRKRRRRSDSAGSAGSGGGSGAVSRAAAAAAKLLSTVRVRLIPVISPAVFSAAVLRPSWNNMRPWVWTGTAPDAAAAAEAGSPTPHYNAAVAEDIPLRWQLAAFHAALASVPAAGEAAVALKSWSRRRGWCRLADHFHSHLLTALVVHLVQRGTLIPAMTGLQALRAVLQFLSTTDLTKYTIAIQPPAPPSAAPSAASSAASGVAADSGDEDDDEDEEDGDMVGAASDDDSDRLEQLDGSDDDDDDEDEDEEGNDEENEEDEDEFDGNDLMNASSGEDEDEEGADGGAGAAPAAAIPETCLRLAEVTPALLAEHRAHAAVLILCPSGLVNMAARVAASAAAELRAEAAIALEAVGTGNSSSSSGGGGSGSAAASSSAPASAPATAAAAVTERARRFEAVFGEVVPPSLAYDRVIAAPFPACPATPAKPAAAAAAAGGKAGKKDKKGSATTSSAASTAAAPAAASLPPALITALCDQPSWAAVVTAAADRVLHAALTDRITLCRVIPVYADSTEAAAAAAAGPGAAVWPAGSPMTWPLDAPPPAAVGLWVCLRLDPHAAERAVDKGPRAQETHTPETAAYLGLWGSLAELRQFSDSAILHSVVWNAAKLGGRAHARDGIVPLIVAHMLARHCGIAMPTQLLHAGDVMMLKPSAALLQAAEQGEEGAALATAVAVAGADVGRACGSLALERVLDTGAQSVVVTEVTVTHRSESTPANANAAAATSGAASASGGAGSSSSSNSNKAAAFSPLTGLPSVAAIAAPAPTVALSSKMVPPLVAQDALARGPAVAFATALATYDWLLLALRNLPGMPISIASGQHVSPGMRYTSAFPPAPHPLCSGAGGGKPADADAEAAAEGPLAALLGGSKGAGSVKPADTRELLHTAMQACESLANARRLPGLSAAISSGGGGDGDDNEPRACQTVVPHEIVVSMEGSAKWPEDPAAIAAVKTAFYLKMKYGLASAHRGVVTAEARPDGLDVLVGGYAFRVVIHYDRELSLLEKIAKRAPLAKAQKHKSSRMLIGSGLPGASAGFGDDSDGDDDDDAEDNEGDDDDGAAGKGKGKGPARLKGFVNVAPTGITKPEAAPKKQHRRAVQASTGVAVGTTGGSRAEVAAALRSVFGKDGDALGAAAGLSAAAAGAKLDALYLRGVARPRHAAAVHSFAQAHPAYGPAVRLASLWLSAHMLGPEAGGQGAAGAGGAAASASSESGLAATLEEAGGAGCHMPIELVELLVAHVFLQPAPFAAPGSPTTAFLRFLRLLTHHDWLHEPLLVDLAGTSTQADVRTLHSRFKAARSGGSAGASSRRGGAGAGEGSEDEEDDEEEAGGRSDAAAVYPPAAPHPSGPAMYVVTPADRGAWRPVWSRHAPSWPVLARLLHLARATSTALAAAITPTAFAPAASTTAPAGKAQLALPFYGVGSRPVYIRSGGGASAAVSAVSAVSALPSVSVAFQRDTAPYHALVTCRAGAVTPRVVLDGRYCGAVRPPLEAAAAVNAPVEVWARTLSSQLAAAAAASAGGGSGKGSGKKHSKVTLAVPSATEAVAQPLVLTQPLRGDSSKFQLQLYKNLVAQSRDSLLIGFDPLACYLRSLRAQFGRYAAFFPDSLRADAIGVVWKPAAFRLPAPEASSSSSSSEAAAAAEAEGLGDLSTLHTTATRSASGTSTAQNAALAHKIMQLTQDMARLGAGYAKTVQLQQ